MKVKIIDKDFYLYCDKNKMSQVFTNLISNSIKFRKKDIPSIIRINFDENNFKINISDNGVGFDNKFKEKIFEVFQRLYTEEKYDGTGIGLTICKKIIEDSGLEIEANGKINEGTTFSIIIPKEKEKYVKQI
jgi:light-regulated signal transduction histidine kinase (bacteriophytochrome)